MATAKDLREASAAADSLQTSSLMNDAAHLAADKTRAEIAKINAEVASLRSQQQAAWARTATVALGLLALIFGLFKTVAEVAMTAQSIRQAQEASKRQNDATASEIGARAEATRLADTAELRLKESSRSEVDMKVLNVYVNDVLPRVSGTSGYHMSERCLEEQLHNKVDPNEAGLRCAGPVQLPRAAQVAAYFAAVSMARRYPMLCAATQAAIGNQRQDSVAVEALSLLGTCPTN